MKTLVETRALLQAMDPCETRDVYLTNTRRQLYILRVQTIDPDRKRLGLLKPSGRRDTIEPGQPWRVRLRESDGVYEAELRHLVPNDNLLWVSLPDQMTFLARRRSIRLAADSRNPTDVSFRAGSNSFDGLLVDLSMDGLGLEMAQQDLEPLAIDGPVGDICFSLSSREVAIRSGKIAHLGPKGSGYRLGIEWVDPDGDVIEVLHDLISDWNLARGSSSSPAREGVK